jgi:hypothetical protein
MLYLAMTGLLALVRMPQAPQSTRTFFVTSTTAGRRALVQSDRMAQLLVDVLAENRRKRRFLLHEFVPMPIISICCIRTDSRAEIRTDSSEATVDKATRDDRLVRLQGRLSRLLFTKGVVHKVSDPVFFIPVATNSGYSLFVNHLGITGLPVSA